MPAVLLTREIANKYRFAAGSEGAPEHICIGTATDPYQPAEKEFGVTRACLEELARHTGLSVSITTKSNLITRDIDVLREIAMRSRLYVDVTVTTLRPRLARLLEPRAPRPDLRLDAIGKLREAGISVGALASPLLPGITDQEGELEALAAAVKQAGALWIASGVLFLMPSSAQQFLPFLREKFPRLVRQYESWYARNAYAPEPYRQQIAARVMRIKAGWGSRLVRGESCASRCFRRRNCRWRCSGKWVAGRMSAPPNAKVSGHDDFVLEAAGGDDEQDCAHWRQRQRVGPKMDYAGAAQDTRE